MSLSYYEYLSSGIASYLAYLPVVVGSLLGLSLFLLLFVKR